MSHVRNQIREFVRASLTQIPGLEEAVAIDSDDIPPGLSAPFVHVDLGGEVIEQVGLGTLAGGRRNLRQLELLTDIYARAKSEALLAAEEYAAAIEAKLAADPRMGGLTWNVSLRTYVVENSDTGDQPITRLRLTWAVDYATNERDATVPA